MGTSQDAGVGQERAPTGREEFMAWLREELPKLLREDPRFASEVVGVLAQTLSPRAELVQVLQEIRALQAEMDRRFEAMEERFRALQADMDRRFELQAAVLAEHSRQLHRLTVGLGSLGHRFGLGFEEAVRAVVEEFAGVGPLVAERLTVPDPAGELYGVPGQLVEFDAFVHDSRRFLVEVKAFAHPEDVLNFVRKVEFARRHLPEPFEPVLVAPFAHARALQLAAELGVRVVGAEPEAGSGGG